MSITESNQALELPTFNKFLGSINTTAQTKVSLLLHEWIALKSGSRRSHRKNPIGNALRIQHWQDGTLAELFSNCEN